MIKLSQRLMALARLVPSGWRAADIGTDHAFLPCYLVENGISPSALGVDVREGPCQAALRTVQANDLADKVLIRLGDGLKPLAPGEVEVAILAGMGGSTMVEILEQSAEVVKPLKRLIFQPMTGSDTVRRWLSANGWSIIAEDLIAEDGRIFEVIAAEKGNNTSLGEAETLYGPLLIKNRHPLLGQILERDIRGVREILNRLIQSQSPEAKAKREEFSRKLQIMESLAAGKEN